MYEKILVPLDGSELAEVALPYVAELAGRLGSQIILIYVNDSGEAAHLRISHFYMQRIGDDTKRAAKMYVKKPGEKETNVSSEILVGYPAEEIVDYADKADVSLIVMATHGRSGIRRWSLGSVADKVVRSTNRPIAIIRAKGAHPAVRDKGMFNRALVPLDGSKQGEAVIPYIEELASRLKTEVTVLQVLSPDWFVDAADQVKQLQLLRTSSKDYVKRVATQLNQKGITTRAEVREVKMDTVAEEIIKGADEVNADVIAMSTHGRSGFSRWAFGSVADRVLQGGNTPLLLVRAY
jgi:nucleotide-binding universal stress UspA family protein